jgi:hypothetical protein
VALLDSLWVNAKTQSLGFVIDTRCCRATVSTAKGQYRLTVSRVTMWRTAQTIRLHEPTNHMFLYAKRSLVLVWLRQYLSGTVLMVVLLKASLLYYVTTTCITSFQFH